MDFRLIILIAFAIALVLAFFITPGAIKLALKIGAVDVPKDDRRMHTKPMPRFGGLGIFIGTMSAAIIAAYVLLPLLDPLLQDGAAGKLGGIIAGGCLMYIVGVVDDLRGLGAKTKFLLQIMCAGVVCAFDIRITFLTNHLGEGHGYLNDVVSIFVTIVWIVGITNAVNLIDGLDGLAAGTAAIASIAIAYTAYIHGMYTVTILMVAVAGGALGFLPYNFYPAKIFMGDSGSLFLGFMLASVSIIGPVKSATVIAVIVPFLVLGLPIFDTGFAILRRMIHGRPIMEADKGHLHHRLIAAGMGQKRSVLMLYGVSGIMGIGAILFSRDLFLESLGLFIIAAMFIYIFLTDANSPFLNLRGINVAREERKERKRLKKEKGDK